MCNRREGLVLIASLAVVTPLGSQSVEVLRARADSLAREWRQAKALADLQDSLRLIGAGAGRDTIRLGALTILANRSPLPVSPAAAIAWPVIERLYGPAAQAVAGHPITIEAVDPDTGVTSANPRREATLRVDWDLDPPALAQRLLNAVSAGASDRRLQQWLGGLLLFDTAATRRAASLAYLELVTRPATTARRCYLGDLVACRAALSLEDTADLVPRWYDAAQRRTLAIRTYQGYLARVASQDDLRACAAGNDSTCLSLLETLPPGHLLAPLGYRARLVLLAVAVELGGPGAAGRLLETPERGVSARLSAAARVSIDSLLARWLSRVRAARPRPPSLPPSGPWIAVGWIGVFATCGLRSSRWRAR